MQQISPELIAAWGILLLLGNIVFDFKEDRFVRWATWTIGWQLVTCPNFWLLDIAYCFLLFFVAETAYHFVILAREDAWN